MAPCKHGKSPYILLQCSQKFRSFHTFCVLYQTPPVQEETVTCISRGKHSERVMGLTVSSKSIIFHLCYHCFSFAAPLHPIPNPWKFQHPFHGRLTSNMLCKRCGHQVSLFDWFTNPVHCNAAHAFSFFSLLFKLILAPVIYMISSLFCLEPCTIWLIWKSVPVHPFASVGKSKHQQAGM